MRRIVLITGGHRSGKSRQAEEMALGLSEHPVYMATAHVWDEEFRQRVAIHQQRRGPQWTNIEEEKWLSRHQAYIYNKVVVIDCVTLWCTNFFFDPTTGESKKSTDEVLQALKEEFDRFTSAEATFIFVTNEIGSGGVSPNPVQRQFTDIQGWLNQYIAQKADEVIMMVSGIPLKIKG